MDIWIVAALTAWVPVSFALALLLGRSITHADQRERAALPPHPGAERPHEERPAAVVVSLHVTGVDRSQAQPQLTHDSPRRIAS
ncbi:hypothetical protein SAMN06264364_12936 [Quadrisphaera granulorum]|uniref:Uncharacterized protein n=1 Tax=Quadrisphaera granulorum TaxID=317664 RepID=A0A315ZSX9_9ACTN|nr:hypothetical protein [Quadrisphaera granulorum]PWJ48655.1 hypothetical protein BXY45_12936 [Quadrisphaera granulorum]SZE98377.1 hypothetical protein SAMN06264364_12936 [Quadrisphaera granulorum]